MQNCDYRKNFLSGIVVEANTTDILPAGNTTTPCSISSQYLYTIVAIYSVVFILLLIVIIIKIIQCVRNCLRPSPYRKYRSGYDAVVPINNRLNNSHHFTDELNPVVDVLINPSTIDYLSEPDTTSEYDNVSLNLEGEQNNDFDDTPPIYEYPPSYPSSA